MRRGPALLAVLLLPALFLRCVDGLVFGDDAPGPEVVRHLFEDILQFQPVRELGRDGLVAQQAPHDIAADGAGGIAVAGMVHAADDGLLEGILMLHGTIDGDGQGFVSGPSAADGLDRPGIRRILMGQIHRFENQVLLYADVLGPEFPIRFAAIFF